jgi:hypothetical protein
LNRAAFGHADRSRARCREIFGGAFCHASSPLLRRAGVNDRRRAKRYFGGFFTSLSISRHVSNST